MFIFVKAQQDAKIDNIVSKNRKQKVKKNLVQ